MATVSSRKRAQPDHELLPCQKKRPPTTDDDTETVLTHGDYNVGWICALPTERAAAEAMLDQFHPSLPNTPLDINSYTLGHIGRHNIVIACLPSGHYGTNNAVAVAKDMVRSFPSIDIVLMVGVGGGAPTGATDIRLGDVVVGEQVIQYDFGKALPSGEFHCTSSSIRPLPTLMTAVSKLRALHCRTHIQIPVIVSDMVQRYPRMSNYARPQIKDQLFRSSYKHASKSGTCDACDGTKIEDRPPRSSHDPQIHYGKVGSGNQVIRDGPTRDKYAKEFGVLCFEMEAAGLMDNFHCLVIRGICDYSDSHKNNHWQDYAAASAAAYTKELLPLLPANRSKTAQRSPETRESTTPQDYRDRVLDSLDFEQRETRHATIKAAHTKTCEWFLNDPFYVDWLDPLSFHLHHGFLWINGKPGVGKSTLMKFCFMRAQKESGSSINTAVVSFFFNARGVSLEKSTPGMYRSLLYQILKKFPDLRKILDEFDFVFEGQSNNVNWDIEILQALFSSVVQNLHHRRVLCFIDALDECDEDEIRAMVDHIEQLGALALETSTHFYVCFSSRHYPYIRIQNGKSLTLEDKLGHSSDLEKYIRGKLQAGNGKGAEEIRSKVLEKSAGVFIWVILVINILNKEYERGRLFAVKQRLNEVPAELGKLFKQILTKDNNNMDDLLLCIQWILYAKRPLSREEFYFALVSGLNPNESAVEWDPDVITLEAMDRFLLSSSKGLAELTKSKNEKTVQFIHESVRDYLIRENGIHDLWPAHAANFEKFSHDRLKECCYEYTKVDVSAFHSSGMELPPAASKMGKDLRRKVTKRLPFLEYATSYVLYHADMACRIVAQGTFLRDFDTDVWLERNNLVSTSDTRRHIPATSLIHILAERNFVNLTETAIRLGWIRTKSIMSDCLITAAYNGYDNLCALLLKAEDIDVNVTDDYGRTPLLCAAEKGHERAFKLLFSCEGVDVNPKDKEGRNPLILAAQCGNTAIFKMLLATENISINYTDLKFGRTPLLWAVVNNHEAIVKLLLATNAVDLNAKDSLGQTPLSRAAAGGNKAITKLLVKMSAIDLNSKDNLGRTPLSWATMYGYEAIVKLLMATNAVELNLRDNLGRTLLSRAAGGGYEAITKLLIATNAIDLDPKDNLGRTPLSYATSGGHEAVKRLLLESIAGHLGAKCNQKRPNAALTGGEEQ